MGTHEETHADREFAEHKAMVRKEKISETILRIAEEARLQGQRRILCHLVHMCFGHETESEFFSIAYDIEDSDRFTRVAGWALICEEGEEFLAKAKDDPPPKGKSRSETNWPGDNRGDMGLLLETHSARWLARHDARLHEQKYLAEQRAMLCGQAKLRFDAATAKQLAALIARIKNFDQLAEIAGWLVTHKTGARFLARVKRKYPPRAASKKKSSG